VNLPTPSSDSRSGGSRQLPGPAIYVGLLIGLLILAAGLAEAHFYLVVVGALLAGGFLLSAARTLTTQHERALSVRPELENLKAQLSSAQFDLRLAPFAERALGQLQRAQAGYLEFRQLLSEKLNPGELTYNRYLTVGDDFSNATFSSLQNVAHLFKQTTLTNQVPTADLELRFAEIDQALAQMQTAQASIAQLSSGSAQIQMSTAIAELEELAGRAKRLKESQGVPDGK
jgi:hypothetical protein